MEKHIYDSFAQRWYRGGSIWFYSDTHFADGEMKYIRTNYIGDEEQIKRINSKVTNRDTFIILGDIGDESYVRKIRGYKVLIKGNHDKGTENYKPYFDEIYEGCLIISPKIILSHEPVEFLYGYNIHGHDHSLWGGGDPNHFNCCAEHINYTPINLNQIIKNGVLKNIPDIHRTTIDEATNKKNTKGE